MTPIKYGHSLAFVGFSKQSSGCLNLLLQKYSSPSTFYLLALKCAKIAAWKACWLSFSDGRVQSEGIMDIVCRSNRTRVIPLHPVTDKGYELVSKWHRCHSWGSWGPWLKSLRQEVHDCCQWTTSCLDINSNSLAVLPWIKRAYLLAAEHSTYPTQTLYCSRELCCVSCVNALWPLY